MANPRIDLAREMAELQKGERLLAYFLFTAAIPGESDPVRGFAEVTEPDQGAHSRPYLSLTLIIEAPDSARWERGWRFLRGIDWEALMEHVPPVLEIVPQPGLKRDGYHVKRVDLLMRQKLLDCHTFLREHLVPGIAKAAQLAPEELEFWEPT